jgi:DNA repair photolyase
MFSGNTDCYQPLEASYRLTRRCLELCLAYGNPVAIVTKGALVQRDRCLLAQLHQRAQVFVFLSMPFDDDALGRAMEPWASAVSRRLAALRALSEAGVPCGVAFAPVIPGLNDHQLPAVLARAREAGATRAFMTLLRLTPEVHQVFEARLREAFPLRADKVLHGLVELRRGRTDERRFGARMRGEGDRWEVLRQLFELTRKRCGYDTGPYPEPPRSFRRPSAQGSLFDEAPPERGTQTPRE